MERIAKLALKGLNAYLLKRTAIRFFGKNSHKGEKHRMIVLDNEIQLDPGDVEQRYFIEQCIREPENIFIYKALAKSGLCDTFVDVGANFGHVASTVYPAYKKLTLIEANPNAAAQLRSLFRNKEKVQIENIALVDSAEIEEVTLSVPSNSSGLATIRASADHDSTATKYKCRASTLDKVLAGKANRSTYIKIDVEGAEEQVLRGGQELIEQHKPIVGFEALSKDVARRCCSLFPQHVFYFARFDFLNASGALTKSVRGVIRAALFGGSIEVLKFTDIDSVPFDNYTQIIAVSMDRQKAFEEALRSEVGAIQGGLSLNE
ncbi:MAG TPA: FkbM family methyltransferase [Opitutaceae bacterium]|nr:FkbM family methyltransferase [Opitutaceae bacterium]